MPHPDRSGAPPPILAPLHPNKNPPIPHFNSTPTVQTVISKADAQANRPLARNHGYKRHRQNPEISAGSDSDGSDSDNTCTPRASPCTHPSALPGLSPLTGAQPNLPPPTLTSNVNWNNSHDNSAHHMAVDAAITSDTGNANNGNHPPTPTPTLDYVGPHDPHQLDPTINANRDLPQEALQTVVQMARDLAQALINSFGNNAETNYNMLDRIANGAAVLFVGTNRGFVQGEVYRETLRIMFEEGEYSKRTTQKYNQMKQETEKYREEIANLRSQVESLQKQTTTNGNVRGPRPLPPAPNKKREPTVNEQLRTLKQLHEKLPDMNVSQLLQLTDTMAGTTHEHNQPKCHSFADVAKQHANAQSASVWMTVSNKKKINRLTIKASKPHIARFLNKGSPTMDRLRHLHDSHLIQGVKDTIASTTEGSASLQENTLINAYWNTQGVLVLEFPLVLTDTFRSQIQNALGGQTVKPLMRLNISMLKFASIPTCLPNRAEVNTGDIINTLQRNKAWENVKHAFEPHFVKANSQESVGMSATLKVGVIDDEQGSVARKLVNSVINFCGNQRKCQKWIVKASYEICGNCSRWGHRTVMCRSPSPSTVGHMFPLRQIPK
ncbi:hypothetical protein AX17_004982 [Amanita inopinata Kibby_2008]|nr:hypothetical protein AX17_004982 [Amanita inopinata Kibby_2008]